MTEHYSDELADKIGELLMQYSMHEIGLRHKEFGLPVRSTLYLWMHKYPYLREKLMQGHEIRAWGRKDDLDEILKKMLLGDISPQAAKVMLDATRWQTTIEAPRHFGPKSTHELTGKDGSPLIPDNATEEDIRARMLEITKAHPELLKGN